MPDIVKKTAINGHHLILQVLENERLIQFIGGKEFLGAATNIVNIPSVASVSEATGLPLHTSNHSWVRDAQRALFNEFLDNARVNGVSLRAIIDNPTTYPPGSALRESAVDYARRFVTDVQDVAYKSLLNGDYFLTHQDPRAIALGLNNLSEADRLTEQRRLASAVFSAERFALTPEAEAARAAELAETRAARAATVAKGIDIRWSAIDTPAKVIALDTAARAADRVPWTTKSGSGFASFNKLANTIDDGSIARYARALPETASLSSAARLRLGPGGLLGIAALVAMVVPEAARAASADTVEESHAIIQDLVAAVVIEATLVAAGASLVPGAVIAVVAYAAYKYATDDAMREAIDDTAQMALEMADEVALRLFTGQPLDLTPTTTQIRLDPAPGASLIEVGTGFGSLQPSEFDVPGFDPDSLSNYLATIDRFAAFTVTRSEIWLQDSDGTQGQHHPGLALNIGSIPIAFIFDQAGVPANIMSPGAEGTIALNSMFPIRATPTGDGNLYANPLKGATIISPDQIGSPEAIARTGNLVLNALEFQAKVQQIVGDHQVTNVFVGRSRSAGEFGSAFSPSDVVLVETHRHGYDVTTNSKSIVDSYSSYNKRRTLQRIAQEGQNDGRTPPQPARDGNAVPVEPAGQTYIQVKYEIEIGPSGERIYRKNGEVLTNRTPQEQAVFDAMLAGEPQQVEAAVRVAADEEVQAVDFTDPRRGAPAEGATRTELISISRFRDNAPSSYAGDRIISVSARLVAERLSNRYLAEGRETVDKDDFEEEFREAVNDQARQIQLGGQIGDIFGSALGHALARGSRVEDLVLGGVLGSLSASVGQAIATGLVTDSLSQGFETGLAELPSNLGNAALGAVSSFLTGELVAALGLDGPLGGLASSVTGSMIGQFAQNVFRDGAKTADLLKFNPTQIASAAGAFVGSFLASQVVEFDTVGGQIGSSIGASLGVIAMAELFKVGLLAGPLGAVIGAFAGFILGGLIGSLFGGTPRSGADVAWDEDTGQFQVENAYARKGGSKEAALAIATNVSTVLNTILAATGSELESPATITTGNYGQRKSDYVYRPVATRDKDAITKRFSGKDAPGQLMEYGLGQALRDEDFKLIGGDVYVKRALYNSIANTSGADGSIDADALLGDLTIARDWSFYHSYGGAIEAIAAALPEEERDAYIAGWVVTAARAKDLGLDRRHASDWFGGFNYILDETNQSGAETSFFFEYDLTSGRHSRVIDLGRFAAYDDINIAGQTLVEGLADADTIDLRSGYVEDRRGFVVNGSNDDELAFAGDHFTALVNHALQIGAGSRSARVDLTLANSNPEAVGRRFAVGLTDGTGVNFLGSDAQISIVGQDALPSLQVGKSFFRAEADEAVFRLSLSRPAQGNIELLLSTRLELRDGVEPIQVDISYSTDGLGGWSTGNRMTLSAGLSEVFVKVRPLVSGSNWAEVSSIHLGAKAVAGAAHLSNGASLHTGKGTRVSGYSDQPLVWLDDSVVHLGHPQRVTAHSEVQLSGQAQLTVSTIDNRRVEISTAAFVEAGAGNDLVHATNLGDNIFGGEGNDTLYGGRLDDWLLGGDGDDRLDAGAATAGTLGGDGNYLNGGAGNDQLFGREGSDWLEGGDGTDVLRAGAGGDILSGGAGAGDELHGGSGDDSYLLRRGDGADIAEDEDVAAPSAPATGDAIAARFAGIRGGTIRRDWLATSAGVSSGTASSSGTGKIAGGEDAIAFGHGITINDVRLSRSGDGKDLLIQLTAIDPATQLEVLTGDSLMVTDWFADPFKRVEWLKFVDGTEVRIGDVTSFIVGTAGDDVLIGTDGNDFVYGGSGNDKLHLLAGNDIGLGGTGDDLVSGGADDDLVVGGLGSDDLIGGSGDDALTGDGGNDSLYGSQGTDILSGGRGNDVIAGGAGNDRFKFSRGDGHDVVFDDYSDHWTVLWKAGVWLGGYVYHPETSEVTAPDGSYVRKNFGTVGEPDLRWVGQFDYDDTTGELRHFTPPAGAATTASDKGEDTIEFALDINVQDVMFERVAGSDDLRVVVSRASAEGSLAGAADSITLRDWYDNPGSIETLAFYQAGEIDVSATGYSLIGGTDGQEGADGNPLRGTAGKDWITGAGGDDSLAGGEGDDIVSGGAGSDHLKGEAGNDVLYGGSGNDVLDGGLGDDVLSGGAGLDAASYASADNAVTVYLTNSDLNQGDAKRDVYDSIENLIGSGAGDVLGADEGDNELTGGKGNDSLLGGLGNDTYRWNIGDGADTVEDIAFVAETIISASGQIAAGYTVTWQQQSGSTKKYDLKLTSSSGEVVYSAVVNIGNGSSTQPHPRLWPKQGWQMGFQPASDGSVSRVVHDMQVDAGDADAIEMGAGISLADLGFERIGDDLKIAYVHVADANNGDGLALGQSVGANLLVRNHFLTNNRVEFLVFADGLSVSLAAILAADSSGLVNGTAADELITGQRGVRDDTLDGWAGHDVISGGEGNDTLRGGDGDDLLEGGMGADQLDGGAHTPDPASGEKAADLLRGDTIRYATSAAGVAVDLAFAGAQAGGDATGDVLTGIENVTGSQHDDSLSGDELSNRLDGLSGNNTIFGRGGNDVLIAGDGMDVLDGGDGEDNLSAAGGNDVLRGGAGKDLLAAGEGDDQLFGDDGDDILSADAGNDHLEGGTGADQLIGGTGNDTLLGGSGADVLAGEGGNDSLQGGADADRYFFAAGFGQDTLTDSEGANEILIDQSIAYDSLWFHRSGSDLVMTVRGSDDRLTITGFFAAENAASVYSVQTSTHRLFLGHSDVRNFLDAMQAAGPDGAPVQIPSTVAALMPRYWHPGDKATPWAEDFALEIAEDFDTGHVAIGAIDHDENIVEYRIQDDALHGSATVDAQGSFFYQPGLNFNGADSFKVAVVDADKLARVIEVKVSVTPVDDAPVIDDPANGPLAIDEDALLSGTVTGSVVGAILAREFDGEAIVFTLTDDADQRFAISGGGVITVADPTRLNHETAAEHTVTVLVTDAVGSTDQRTFTIAVRDMNEENALPAAYGWDIAESNAVGAVVGTVAAADPDNAGTAFADQRYAFAYADNSLHQVSADGRYAIDALTGVVAVAALGNFEAAEPTRSYVVEARDNAGQSGFTSSRTQVTIAITDLNEANGFAGDLALTLAENEGAGRLVGTVTASDPDTAGTVFAVQSYFFWDGAQISSTSADGRFAIDPLTGAITATGSYDYESDDRDETYVVVARDNAGVAPFFSAYQNVAISLTNVNETPVMPALQSALSFIIEGAAAGTVAAQFALADPDLTTPTLVPSDNPGGLFSIAGADLQLAATVDFETLAGLGFAIADQDGDGRSDIRVSLSFHADDGELQSTETAPVVFYVEDVNEAPTALVDSALAASFAERDRIAAGTARPAITLATLAVTDADLAGQANAQYTFVVDDPRFEMVGNQLRLREGVAFDHEAEPAVTVRVTATDHSVDPLTISRDFTFAVDNRDDILEGTPDADVLVGQANRDVITGLSGNDRLEGLTGNDDLLGGDGADSLYGGDGDDRLEGGSDDDLLFGEGGNDTLLGGSGHDRLSGGDGADAIDGGLGDDTIVADADAAADAIQGGDGTDRLTFSGFSAGVTADLSVGLANGDTVAGVEELEGSPYGDSLTGDAGANRLIGGQGDDVLAGLAGSDRIEGGEGADTLAGGADDDLLFGDAGNDALGGGTGSDALYGGDGADSLLGDAGDDRLEGGRGDDVLDAGDGNDTYIVDRRSDHDVIFNYDGTGDDIDVLGFSDTHGEITEHDLWFQRQGDDLLITVVGENTSVRVTNWYLVTDPSSRANHRLDFLLGGEWFSRDTDVEALVDFQSNFAPPATVADLDALRTDPVYEATIANFFGINAPPTITGIADQNIAEDGTLQLVLTVADDITPAAGVTLQGVVLSGNELLGPQGLVIGAVGADGRVSVTLAPAAHVAGIIDLSFTATDAGGIETTQQLRLTIDPVADTPLITQLSATPATSGAAIAISLSVEFPDRDGSEAHSIRIGGIPVGVSLNQGVRDSVTDDWVMAPADLVGLALLAPVGWSQDLDLTVKAYASEAGSTAISALAALHMVINAPPTDIQSGLTVTENTANGTVIGRLTGIDPDGDQLVYTLLDSAGGRFALDTDGWLSVADGSLIDYEAASSHQIRVRVTDPFSQSIERVVTVGVTNTNEANAMPARYDFALDENLAAGTPVGTVGASDPDGAGHAFGRQRYGFLVSGALQQVSNDGLFAIDALTGAITTRTLLDYEAIASASYVVAARDNEGAAGANQALTTVHIAVGNRNEANSLPATMQLSVAENAAANAVVGQVVAGDPDAAPSPYDEQRYYFRVNGALSTYSADGRYSIEATTGLVRATRSLDRESADALTSHVVVARDNRGEAGFNETASTVTIVVDNVNEAPTISGSTSPAVFAEPVAAGTVLAGFAASDPDGTSPALQLVSNTNLFAVSGSNIVLANGAPTTYLGALAYANARGWGAGDIDGDGLADVRFGTVEVVASDGSLSSGVVRRDIYFEDVNSAPNAPVVSSSLLYAETGDGGTHALNTVATFSLSDPDGSQPQLVITGGNGNNWFTVSGDEITFAAGVNFTADYLRQNFGTAGGAGFSSDVDGDGLLEVVVANLTVAARDASGAFSPGVSYAVRIEDRNESPAFNASSYAYGLAESATAYTQVGQVGASDIDGPASALRYAFAGGTSRWDATLGANVSASADGRLVVNTTSGAVYVASDGVFNGQPPLDYSVIVTDRNGGAHALTATADLHVNVIGVNDPHSLVNASGSVNEASGLEPLTPLIDLRERMLVDPENQNMRWRFANGTNVDDSGIWLLTSDGSLTLNTGSVDYEALVYYTETIEREHPITHEIYFEEVEVFDPARATRQLQVEAIDDSTGVVAGGTFTVTVNDVNEQVVVNPTPSFVEDDDDPAGVFRLSATEFYVMGEIVEGRIVALNTFDPERRSLTYSLSNVNHTDYNIRIGDADNDIDSSYPILSISSNGLITFTLPPGSGGDSDSKWQGGTRTSTLGRREHGIIYNFDVNVTDSAGLVTTIPFTIRFLRRETTTPPVVFDLDGDGIELVSSVDSTVYFDMDLDGIGDRTGWVGADDAMLVLDRNGNGVVDDAAEISFTDFVEGAQTDLEGLVAFDSNQNGILDAGDDRFFEFRVWRDLDQDGVSDAGELLTWDQAGISSLSLGGTISENPFISPENLVWATTAYQRRDGSSGLAGDVLLAYEGSAEIALAAPVLLDFDGDGTTLVGLAASKTSFDQDGDGDKERTAWFESGDAVLAIDRNKNGVIDDISEISFLGDLEGAETDLEGLVAYDQNKDGKIDASDIDFAALKLWFDKDSDGITDAGELRSLSEAGIASLSLTSTLDAGTGEQADGSMIYGKASFVFDGGKTGTMLDTGLAYLANSQTHATAIAGQPVAEPEFTFADASFERKAKKHLLYSLGGELAVHLRKGGEDMDARAGTVGAAASLTFAGKNYGYLDAVVLDLDGDGVETKRRGKTGAAFDMNGDGSVDNTGWTASRDGFLVVDRNENGMIDDGSELSFMLDAPEARSAMAGLAAFDSNGDGLISRLDQRFGELKVWVDADHDGVSDAGELTSLSDQGIVSISLRSAGSEDMQKLGRNVTLSTTVFTREDGSTRTAADVAFGFAPGREPAATRPAAVGPAGTIADWLGKFADRPFEQIMLEERELQAFALPHSLSAAGLPLPSEAVDEAAQGARRLALLLQDMAAFGTSGALHDQEKGREAARVPLDFFA